MAAAMDVTEYLDELDELALEQEVRRNLERALEHHDAQP